MNHQPVMTKELMEGLNLHAGGIYVDATFGGGGHTQALLQRHSCTIHGFDRDASAIEAGRVMASSLDGKLYLHHGLWSEIKSQLEKDGITKVDGIMVDCGISSMQLDDAPRGFSFQRDGPLNMGMGKNKKSAHDVVNNYSSVQLIEILRDFGNESRATAIVRRIIDARNHKPIDTTLQLAALCGSKHFGHHPATRTFLALRLYVNDEMNELHALLDDANQLLRVGGRLAVMSFHGTEDVIVKRFLRRHSSRRGTLSRLLPYEIPRQIIWPYYKLVTRHVIKPSREEIRGNPRARSARLRIAERLETKI